MVLTVRCPHPFGHIVYLFNAFKKNPKNDLTRKSNSDETAGTDVV